MEGGKWVNGGYVRFHATPKPEVMRQYNRNPPVNSAGLNKKKMNYCGSSFSSYSAHTSKVEVTVGVHLKTPVLLLKVFSGRRAPTLLSLAKFVIPRKRMSFKRKGQRRRRSSRQRTNRRRGANH